MEIVALQQYTDNKISLYEGEIRNIGNNLAQKLIAKGIVAEHSDSGSDEGGNNGVLVIQEENGSLNILAGKLFQEMQKGTVCFIKKMKVGPEAPILAFIQITAVDYFGEEFQGGTFYTLEGQQYNANSPNDYPRIA